MNDRQSEERVAPAVDERLIPLLLKLLEAHERPEKGCFTIAEAAAFVSCSTDLIRRHMSDGSLPAANISTDAGPDYRILRTDLMAWLRQRKTQVAPRLGHRKSKEVIPAEAPYQSRHHRPSAPSPSHAI